MEALLEAREISLTYRSGGVYLTAVDRVCVAIRPGEFCGVMGPSGNGKSSLLYILSGLKQPTAGEVQFRGRSYASYGNRGLADLRHRHFGFIFQQHFLINHLNVLENVLVALHPEADRGAGRLRALELLGRLGMGDCLRRYPHELSGGQRQRVAVARSLVGSPNVVFADEPTASLDRATARDVLDILGEFRSGGGAIVLVTHDPEAVEGADRVVVMRDGRLSGEKGA